MDDEPGPVPARSAWSAILHMRCPRCREGRVFAARFAMNDRCPVCGLLFMREPGYFTGAMYISYALALFTIVLFTLLLWSVAHLTIVKDVIWAVVLFLPLAPAVTLFARILWIYLDQAVDPDKTT